MQYLNFRNIFFLVFLLFFNSTFLFAQEVQGIYHTDGQINAMKAKDGKLFIGGAFNNIGYHANGLSVIDSNGISQRNTKFLSNNKILDAIEDGQKGYFIAGSFTIFQGESIPYLVRLDSNLNIDKNFNLEINNEVTNLYKDGDFLYIIGLFDTIDDLQRNRFCVFDINTKKITSFNPTINGSIQSVSFTKDFIFLQGPMNRYNGKPAANLVQLKRPAFEYVEVPGLNSTSSQASNPWPWGIIDYEGHLCASNKYASGQWADMGYMLLDTNNFELAKQGTLLNGKAYCIIDDLTKDSGWYIGGNFRAYEKDSVVNIARLNPKREIDTTFILSHPYQVHRMAQIDSFLFCAGPYAGNGYLSIYNINTQKEIPHNLFTNDSIRQFIVYKKELIIQLKETTKRYSIPDFMELKIPEGYQNLLLDVDTLLIASSEQELNYGLANLASFNKAGDLNQKLTKNRLYETFGTLEYNNGKKFVFGYGGIFLIDSLGQIDSTLSFTTDRIVHDVKRVGDSLYLAGNFNNLLKLGSYSRIYRGGFAILSLSDGTIKNTSLNIIPTYWPWFFNEVKFHDNKLYVGENSFGNNSIQQLQIYSLDSFKPIANAPSIFSQVKDILFTDTSFYVSGDFTEANSLEFPGLVSFNTNTLAMHSWKPLIDTLTVVSGLTMDQNYIYALSKLQTGKVKVYKIDRTNGNTTLFGNFLDSSISQFSFRFNDRLKRFGDTIFAYGEMRAQINGVETNAIFRFNKNTGEYIPFNSYLSGNVSTSVRTITKDGENYILGGRLEKIGKKGNSLVHKYDLISNKVDTSFSVSKSYSTLVGNKPVSMLLKDTSLFFLHPQYLSKTLEGRTRNYLFGANKLTGNLTDFDAKLPSWGYAHNIRLVEGPKNNMFILSSGRYNTGHEFKIANTDSVGHKNIVVNGNIADVSKDKYNNFYLLGYQSYNIHYSRKEYNPNTLLFEYNKLNAKAPNAKGQLQLIHNYKDSLFYYADYAETDSFNLYEYNKNTDKLVRKSLNINSSNIYFSEISHRKVQRIGTILAIGGSDNGYLLLFDLAKDQLIKGKYKLVNNKTNKIINLKNKILVLGDFDLTHSIAKRNFACIDLEADSVADFNIYFFNRTIADLEIKDSILYIPTPVYDGNNGSSYVIGGLNIYTEKLVKKFGFPNNEFGRFTDIEIDGNYLYGISNISNAQGSGISNLMRFEIDSSRLDLNWNPQHPSNKISANIKAFDSSLYVFNGTTTSHSGYGYPGITTYSNKNASKVDLDLGFDSYKIFSLTKANNHFYTSGSFYKDATIQSPIQCFNATDLTKASYNPSTSTGSVRFVLPFGDKYLMHHDGYTSPKFNSIETGNMAIIDAFSNITYPLKDKIRTNNTVVATNDSSIYMAPSGAGPSFVNYYTENAILKYNVGQSIFGNRVTQFEPRSASNFGRTTVTLTGSGFSSNSRIALINDSDTIWMNSLEFVNNNILKVKFNFSNDSLGNYAVLVHFKDGNVKFLQDSFLLEPQKPSKLSVEILGFDTIRPNRWSDYDLILTNNSNSNLENLPIFIGINAPLHKLTLKDIFTKDTLSSLRLDSIYNFNDTIHVYSLILNSIAPSASKTVSLKLNPKSKAFAGLHIWHHASLRNAQSCFNEVLTSKGISGISNICIRKALDNAADSMTLRNHSTSIFNDVRNALDFTSLVEQANKDCNSTSVSNAKLKDLLMYLGDDKIAGNDTACSYLSTSDSIFLLNKRFHYPIAIINSLDPNDKIGPKGISSNNSFKELPDIFRYKIRFENDSTATANAQRVFIIDTLDTEYFDVNSVRFSEVQVGDFEYKFETPVTGFNKYFDFKEQQNLILNVKSEVDKVKGIIKWTFTSLDASTLLFDKLNPTYGFLPPNRISNEGQGSVSFTIKLLPNVNFDSPIKNRADIIFDENKSILTPFWSVLKDSAAPISSVNSLPSKVNDSSFAVSWSGTDATGISTYSVFYSKDDVHYLPWISNTVKTDSIFKGKPDTTYHFYSIAQDLLGNIEIAPSNFDAKTTIDLVTIKTFANSPKYKVFPNPSEGSIFIKTESYEHLIKLYTTNGKLIRTCKPNTSLNLNDLAKGMYLIELLEGSKTYAVEKIKLK